MTPRPRILIIDDNAAIHDDFRKILCPEVVPSAVGEMEAALFGSEATSVATMTFEMDSAYQGQEALGKLVQSIEQERPYSLAFVDGRMPPGWDGVETVMHLWKTSPELQVVICTAYSDYSWEEIVERIGQSDNLVILKKPFDAIEVLQIAHALTRKWDLARQARASMGDLDRKVAERTQALEREMAERARVEDTLRQAQKMDAVGQLAAGVAHDFNNLLNVIQGYAGLLLDAPAEGFDAKEALQEIAVAADRASALTRQLLVFSRKDVVCCKPLDFNLVLTNANKFLRRVIGEQVELQVDLSDGSASLMADEANLAQVIMNLAINARDAMPGGGRLTLRTTIEQLDEEGARRHPQARPGAFVCLTVSDTGCGMDAATLSRIFEPFFTTKEVGKGTGLGLATVYGIIQRHSGWIEVDSQPGQGTTFRAFLPLQDAAEAPPTDPDRSFRRPPESARALTILVVEDDVAVRKFAKTVLVGNSYRVIEATDGVNALEVWSEHAGHVDALFTDMVMPNGLSGRGLADKLKAQSPSLKVVYCSGYSTETIGADWLQDPGVGFLAKPYSADDLLRAVHSSLALPSTQRAA